MTAIASVRRRTSQLTLRALLVIVTVSFLWYSNIYSHLDWRSWSDATVSDDTSLSLEKRGNAPIAEDTLVILKTGATEIQDKLPVHLATTMQCYPNMIIFSNHDEVFEGYPVHDAFRDVDPHIKETHPDFELWRRLHEGGRQALFPDQLSGSASSALRGTGDTKNPGWKLDKWKFLPMVTRTWQEHPIKKWYVFIETDTYMLWHSMLAYLSALDWTKPYYMGAQIWIGGIVFAHGGTGFIVSRSALRKVVEFYTAHQAECESFTDGHWAGDCVLGKAFKDSGTDMTYVWPILQGDSLSEMEYDRHGAQTRFWCQPTVTYHHEPPATIKEMWDFERDWAKQHNKTSDFLRHRDIFQSVILPKIIAEPVKTEWDNHSSDDEGPTESLETCRTTLQAICSEQGRTLPDLITTQTWRTIFVWQELWLDCLSHTKIFFGCGALWVRRLDTNSEG